MDMCASVARPETGRGYVLVTAACNEEAFIENTLRSVLDQTVLPRGWVIVSDGSVDRTDDIARRFAARCPLIQVIRRERPPGRSFGSKVNAVREGFLRARQLDYDFIGNLDADITLQPAYFERLIEKFRQNPNLGIAGGWIHEPKGGRFVVRRCNSVDFVPHAIHLLRRACYEAIGDYVPLPYGGEDTCAAVLARMHGWRAEAFKDLVVCHHRRTAGAGSVLRNRFRQGLADHSLGYHPAFELLKCIRRVPDEPALVGAAAWLLGFIVGCLREEERLVSPEFVEQLRREQAVRLRSLVALKRVM